MKRAAWGIISPTNPIAPAGGDEDCGRERCDDKQAAACRVGVEPEAACGLVSEGESVASAGGGAGDRGTQDHHNDGQCEVVPVFRDAQTTLNILVTLEDAFIAAYLVGFRNFSTSDLRVTAARIMGIESDHRTLARVVGPGVATSDGGPIETITGAQGVAESVDPPNNNGYERALGCAKIDQAVAALTPFPDKKAAKAAGFDTQTPYDFVPFTLTLANPLGEFISFAG